MGRAGQYLRGGGDRRALGLRDRREEQRSPEEGLESARSLAEGRLQARARQQPRGPLPGPPGAHKNPLPLRLWLSWDALSWGHLATSGGAVTKGEGATGADGRLHTLGGTGAHGAGCPDARDKVEEALYTLDPESRGAQAWDGPADCVRRLYLKPRQVGRPCPAEPAPHPSVPRMSNQLLPIQIQSRQLKPYSFLSSFSWAPSPGSRSR